MQQQFFPGAHDLSGTALGAWKVIMALRTEEALKGYTFNLRSGGEKGLVVEISGPRTKDEVLMVPAAEFVTIDMAYLHLAGARAFVFAAPTPARMMQTLRDLDVPIPEEGVGEK